MPSHLPAELRRRVEPIRLLILDVDGVLTDGALSYGPAGETVKRFNVRDGLALRLLAQTPIVPAIISGRRSEAVAIRCRELQFREELVIQASRDKEADLESLERILGIDDSAVAAMGDDLPDLPLLRRAAFAACPADATPEVAAVCHHICGAPGGRGAVREVVELLLKAQGLWQATTAHW